MSAVEDSMRERRELTRAKVPAFLSEASMADVDEQLAVELGTVTTGLNPEKEKESGKSTG